MYCFCKSLKINLVIIQVLRLKYHYFEALSLKIRYVQHIY